MRKTLAILALLLTAVAQQPPPTPSPQAARPAASAPQGQQPSPTVTFTSTTQLVVEAVTVKDKDGKPIEGLTAKDFTVTEDGKPQTISCVEFQKLPDETIDTPVVISTRGEAVPKLARTSIAPEKPGEVRYRDRRLLALYFDMTAMSPPDQM